MREIKVKVLDTGEDIKKLIAGDVVGITSIIPDRGTLDGYAVVAYDKGKMEFLMDPSPNNRTDRLIVGLVPQIADVESSGKLNLRFTKINRYRPRDEDYEDVQGMLKDRGVLWL